MTHDELITELNRRLEIALYNGDPQAIHALKAVVELHKPFTEREDGLIICNVACNDEGGYFEPYPCPTIKAIELNLQ